MNHILIRSLIILLVSALVAIVANLVNPNGVDWVGYWPNVSDSDTIWLSPSYDSELDPPAIHLALAYDHFLSRRFLFVDAREPEEYEDGHIRGAINLPFDSFDDHWPDVEPLMPADTPIVVYCSGTECESSLHLARLLEEEFGYEHVEIFFGGWRGWFNERLPMEGKRDYEHLDE
jgi:rhodanese-related sulfurtransferase